MEVISGFPARVPKFFLVTYGPAAENDSMELPKRFIDAVGNNIPSNIKLQFPNGRQIHIHYKKTAMRLTSLDPLFNELGGSMGFFLHFSYTGNGVFNVCVIEKNLTEVEYTIPRKIARSPLIYQDKTGGKRWKFIAYASVPVLVDGSIPIPKPYLDRFRNILPEDGTVTLANGENHSVSYSRSEGRMYGLKAIIDRARLAPWDLLLFAYRGNGKFTMELYDSSKTEKLWIEDPIVIGSDSDDDDQAEVVNMQSSEIPETVEAHANQDADDADTVALEDSGDENENNIASMEFTRILTKSNVDQSTHGVHIPTFVTPRNREWISGETVTLTTHIGSWPVVVVRGQKNARFSGGWNQFSLKNKLVQNQMLRFTMFDNDDGVGFHVN